MLVLWVAASSGLLGPSLLRALEAFPSAVLGVLLAVSGGELAVSVRGVSLMLQRDDGDWRKQQATFEKLRKLLQAGGGISLDARPAPFSCAPALLELLDEGGADAAAR